MIQEFFSSNLNLSKPRLCALFLGAVLLFSVLLTYAHNTQTDIANGVIRLHIIADSNTATDQALKLKVRNRILKESESWLNEVSDRAEAMQVFKMHTAEIEQAAQDEIKRNGRNYPVRVEIGRSIFPTKTYGSVILPAGEYDAVRLIIGSGKGENWWCVMFPPLCFVNGAAQLPPDSEEYLRSSLTTEEYELITGQESGELPVQIKFKLVELAGKLCQNLK